MASRRALALVAAAMIAAVFVLSAGLAEAKTRTTKPKAKPVAQVQQAAPEKSAKPAAKKAPAAKAPATKAPAAKTPATKPATKTKSHGHKAPEPVEDPVEMNRASHTVRGRKVSTTREVASQHEAHATTVRGKHAVHADIAEERMPAPVVKARKSATAAKEVAPTETAAAAEKKTGTTDDFLRAAQGIPVGATGVFAEGEAHPDDDERLPLKAAPVAEVSANDAVKASVAPMLNKRVSGFGAEGDTPTPSHRTLAQTMAKHHAATPVADAPTAAEQEQITEAAVQPMVLPALYTPGGRLIMPAPLKGSHDVLVHQNTMADSEGLDRIENDAALDRMVATHVLVRLPETASLHVNEDLPANRRYARPWTVKFVTDIAAAYSARFHQPLQVNSAVRTVAYQIRLMRVNGNAAPPEGATASPHLTGQAIDFGKRGMSAAEIAWMRAALLPLMKAGKLDVEEEFQQACFHISVYRSYMPAAGVKKAKVQVAAVKVPRSDETGTAEDNSLM